MVKRERKIIVYIAISADGYIARADGSVEWLNRPRTAGDYGMSAFYRSIDTILWGRKTLEAALGFQKKGQKGSGFDANVNHGPAKFVCFHVDRCVAVCVTCQACHLVGAGRPGCNRAFPLQDFAHRLKTHSGASSYIFERNMGHSSSPCPLDSDEERR